MISAHANDVSWLCPDSDQPYSKLRELSNIPVVLERDFPSKNGNVARINYYNSVIIGVHAIEEFVRIFMKHADKAIVIHGLELKQVAYNQYDAEVLFRNSQMVEFCCNVDHDGGL